VIDQVVTDLVPLAAAKQIELRWTRGSKTGATIMADLSQMERMIRNLVDNAVKYTPAGGSVTLQCVSGAADSLEIRVTDTGIGIPPEHQTRVFDRFYRVDPSHTIPGTGLGLSIVKEIANIYGGDVQLESEPGAGSTFIVTLPDCIPTPAGRAERL